MNRLRDLAAPILLSLAVATLGCSRRAAVPSPESDDMLPGPTSPQLRTFLTTEDLDDLLHAGQAIKALDAADTAAVRAVLEQWAPPQAVANLLIHPGLVPEDVRLATLFRGLDDPKTPYLVLAAIVGLGGEDKFSVEDRKRVATRLLTVIRESGDVRAERASVTLTSHARVEDAPQVIALLGHSNKTVRHNLLAWLFHTFKDGDAEPVAAAARASGLSREAQARVVADYQEAVANPRGGFESSGAPLLSYIPNLREYKPESSQPENTPAKIEAVILSLPRRGATTFADHLAALRDPEADTRRAALKSLRRLAPSARKSVTKEQLAVLAAVLKDKDSEARMEAAAVLGRLGAEARAALPALFEAARDTSNPPYIATPGSLSEAAIAAALRIDPQCGPALAKACMPTLIASLGGNDQDGIRVAAKAVARLAPHGKDAIPALAKASKVAKGYSVLPVVEALSAIGREADKPLGELIHDTGAPLESRQQAMKAIAERDPPDERQVAILIAALKDRERAIRAGAVEAIRALGPGAKAATPALLSMLDDPDLEKAASRPWVKDILVGTLARMGDAAVPSLIAVVKGEGRSMLARLQAIRALGQMGRKAESAQPALAAAMAGKSLAVAVEAAGSYPLVGGEVAPALPVLQRGLRDDSPQVIRTAVAAVERLGPKVATLVPELTRLLKYRDPEVRRAAVRAVGTMGAAARPAVPALAELLKSGQGEEDTRRAVAEALQRLGHDAAAALPALIDQLKHLEKRSPNAVIVAVGKLGREGKPAVPALVKLMEKDDDDWPFFSTDAIDALGEIGPEAGSAVPQLVAQLRKSSTSARARAARTLGRIGPDAREAMPELEKRLKDVSLDVRIWAAFALIRISGDPKGRMAPMIGWWNKGQDLSLAEAFQELGSHARPARDRLLEALEDEDTMLGIHRRVAHALGRLTDEAGVIVPRLLALIDRPRERFTRQQHREHALQALALLGPSAKAAIPRLQALVNDNDEAVATAATRALEKVQGK